MAKNLTGDMPHSLEAEQALIGCLLLDTRIQVEVAAYIKESDFYAESHQYIFSAMQDIIRANMPVDLVTLTDALEKKGTLEQAGGINYITELTNAMPSAANFQRYLDIVRRDSMLRSLIKGAAEIVSVSKSSTDEKAALAYAEKTVYDISNTADTSEIVKIGSVIPEVITKFDELSKDKSKFKGIKTGYKGLDNILNGLHGSDLMILAARPGIGKTSLAMNIVENVALQGYSSAVFSLEMPAEQLALRMLCTEAKLDMQNVRRGRLEEEDWEKLSNAMTTINDAAIFVDATSGLSVAQIRSKARRLQMESGLDLVMIDYLQLMSAEGRFGSRQEEVSTISRMLKGLAQELNVPIIALSQLSRAPAGRSDHRPVLSDIRDSGAIEQDADVVMFLHREDYYNMGGEPTNIAEVIIAKQRNGALGTVNLIWHGEYTWFQDPSVHPNEAV